MLTPNPQNLTSSQWTTKPNHASDLTAFDKEEKYHFRKRRTFGAARSIDRSMTPPLILLQLDVALVIGELGFPTVEGEDVVALGMNENLGETNLLQIFSQRLRTVPRIEANRISSDVDSPSREEIDDLSHHPNQNLRFFGVGASLFANQPHGQGNDDVANLNGDGEDILSVECFVESSAIPVIAVGEQFAVSLLDGVVHSKRYSVPRLGRRTHRLNLFNLLVGLVTADFLEKSLPLKKTPLAQMVVKRRLGYFETLAQLIKIVESKEVTNS